MLPTLCVSTWCLYQFVKYFAFFTVIQRNLLLLRRPGLAPDQKQNSVLGVGRQRQPVGQPQVQLWQHSPAIVYGSVEIDLRRVHVLENHERRETVVDSIYELGYRETLRAVDISNSFRADADEGISSYRISLKYWTRSHTFRSVSNVKCLERQKNNCHAINDQISPKDLLKSCDLIKVEWSY